MHPMEHPRKSASKWERSKNAGRRLQFAKKYTVSGLVCRDSHVASPLERLAITYTRMIVGFYEPRTTNHGLSSDSDAAFRRDRLKLTTTLRETLSA